MTPRYKYRRVPEYEACYEVVHRFTTIGDVERNPGPPTWTAELNDGRTGHGRTRGAAVDAARGVPPPVSRPRGRTPGTRM